MKYPVTRNPKYDFLKQSYASIYPNLHKYPATMLPQIGVEILKELNITKGKLLDPYCGSGSSFASGLECGLTEMYGFDINPLAVLISKVKFTKLDIEQIRLVKQDLRNKLFDFVKKEENINHLDLPNFTNIDYWYSKEVLQNLSVIRLFINQIENQEVKNFFFLPFSETIRECSYVRNNEFKLFRMKPEDILLFNPDVLGVYFKKLNQTIDIYEYCYLPKLKEIQIGIDYQKFQAKENYFDVVLTSPPYGDSKTTVAYGQFSNFSNEWMGIDYARKVDTMLMGGKKVKSNYQKGVIKDYIAEINKISPKRALEVSAFYFDLEKSIKQVATCLKKGGKIIYVVGNRRVKDIQLPTDQFIAEKFEELGFNHLVTYERLISNKSLPLKNSPNNQVGNKKPTMSQEFIVICDN